MASSRLSSIFRHNAEVIFFVLISILIQCIRSSIHVDEGRYLSSAYEMYQSGNYLIPHLNGIPYSHKPPLLFWITCLFWKALGVSDFVARLIPIISTAITAIIVRKISDRQASSLFLSTGLIFIWSQFYMFDCLMMMWVSLGWYGLITRRFYLLSLAVTCGLLTKGPVVFVYLIPAAVFFKTPTIRGFLAGLIIPLVWLSLALLFGDPAYREAIVWKQTAGRLVNSFHHQRGWWFYLVVFPLMFLPWIAMPKLWLRSGLSDFQKRILKASLVSFIVFQAISCKQIQYLLPLIPILMVVISQRLVIPRLRIIAVGSVVFFMGIMVGIDGQIQRRYPIAQIANYVQTDLPFTVVTHRYRGELGFALKKTQIRILSEEEFAQKPLQNQLIIYTKNPQYYPKPVYSAEQKSGHYILIVDPSITPVVNSGSLTIRHP